MSSAAGSPPHPLRRLPLVAAAIAAGLGVIALTLLLMRVTGQDDGVFTRDVRAVAADEGVELPIYTGLISILNNLIWTAAAALALCTAALNRHSRSWHLRFGCLLLILAADDSYMLHESSGSRWLELGLYAVYALIWGWLLLDALRELHGTAALAFLIGSGFLVVAAYLDVATHANYLAEDGSKLIGSLVWLTIPIADMARTHTQRRYDEGELPDRRSTMPTAQR